MKQGLPDVPTWQEFLGKVTSSKHSPTAISWRVWALKNLEENTRIGIDPTLLSAGDMFITNHKSPSNHHHIVDAESLKKSLEPRKSEIVSIDKNLVDIIWSQERPERPKNKIFPLETKYSGESSQEKIRRLREELTEKGVKAMVVTMLDEVAWLFNLRGTDIDFNPGSSLIHVETPELN